MKPSELAIQLACAESEDEVVSILAENHLWKSLNNWVPFGDNENNFSTIGNQQSKADAALVEKMVNSIDAVLMKQCLIEHVHPESAEAPKTIVEAMERFFHVKHGQLSEISVKQRKELAQNIILAATGSSRKMNLVLADQGEGQTPLDMAKTILSLNKSNKLKIQFVQGKFNMGGGSGALPFCGKRCIQVIISKRCPDINNLTDPYSTDWSFTVVRREEPRDGRKSSMYTYLVNSKDIINGTEKRLFHFQTKNLAIIPQTKNVGAYQEMQYGTFIKLFDYQIPRYKSNIQFDFNYRMSMLLPNLAHPILLRECRDIYSGHTFETVLSGLTTRLTDDRSDNIEEGYPDSNQFYIEGQKFNCSIYVFIKKRNAEGKMVSASKNYRESDGVIFSVNGQTHATLPESLYNSLDLSYLSDSLLVLVDCSDVDVVHRENLFMNSRDRLRDSVFSRLVKDRIKEILRNHQGLKQLQNRRRAEAIHEKIGDDKPLQNVLQNIISKSPVLSKVLFSGIKLSSPFNLEQTGTAPSQFNGKKHPTYFSLKGKTNLDIMELHKPANHDFRVQYETDAENDYFYRNSEAGKLVIFVNDEPAQSLLKHLGLFNGIATLTFVIPHTYEKGVKYQFTVFLVDDCIVNEFKSDFILIPEDEVEYARNGSGGNRINPPSDKDSDKREVPSRMAMPNVIEVIKSEWAEYGMDEKSALAVKTTPENTDFFVNMDNLYLLVELKNSRNTTKDLLTKSRYKYCMVLIGLSVLNFYKDSKPKINSDSEESAESMVANISEMLSPVVLPMLDSMAELREEDLC